jgi:protein involved in polysaccharide export with SLBB domain
MTRGIVSALAGNLSSSIVGFALCAVWTGQAQDAKPASGDASTLAPETPPGVISLSALTNRAPWQQRLTVGPGDQFRVALYGTGGAQDITVGLDGRISFLQVRDYPVTGLTIDELREKLDQELGKYYLAARTMVYPVQFRSKRYFILGKGAGRGVFVLERPLTLIEAITQAGGLSVGTFEGNPVELADLQRSFFIRGGKRLNLNLESLFLQGDLSQNVAMEPDDYVYIASADANEIYIAGQVLSPRATIWTPAASVLAVIAAGGGFGPKAYKQRVLVVRGSLTNPQTYVVNVGAILKGRDVDVRLQPRDIVYVAARPWYKAEEILEYALDSFVYGAVDTYARSLVIPLIR